jgi:Ca-activated chloride channel family protein
MNLGAPWMLLLLSLVALAGWLMARARRLQREAACRLKGVAPASGQVGLVRQDLLTLAALACIVVALARPQWNPRPYEVQRRGRDLVIALDVSRSMLAADVFPSRLEAARIAILESIPEWTGQRIALVTFAGSASVRVPLTLDHGFVRYMLQRADPSDMDVGGTSLQAAFEKAVDTVLSDTEGGRRDLLVFTDGEDHLSDLERTAQLLANSNAAVLIIGLGDPVQGARVPDASETGKWMQYNDADVVSRLEESALAKLSAASRSVTYYPARTRPFDLGLLYDQLTSGAADGVVVGQLQHVRYTEAYPYLLALSVALWLASAPLKLQPASTLVLMILLQPGCESLKEEDTGAAFRARIGQGAQLLQSAEEQSDVDAAAQRSLLLDAREQFLRAALLRPGDLETARRITHVTRRLRDLEAAIQQQRAEEQERHDDLAAMIARLQKLTERQTRLSLQSQRILRRYPVPSSRVMNRLAALASREQQSVRQGTSGVFENITYQRDTLRQLLTKAYGDIGRLPATELDPIVDLLAGTVAAQQDALANLTAGSVRWPKANTALHTASERMHQALETLRRQQPPSKDQQDNAVPSRNERSSGEDMEGLDSEAQGDRSQNASAGDFQAALSLRSLPVPNYTSAEILAEESANQEKRVKRKAAYAGAKVERNW